jgi:cell fate regulator YaaT (PSP1 superfamily)
VVPVAGEFVLLRVGLLGQIGRFTVEQARPLKRGTRVVCRTQRGLEVGVSLGNAESTAVDGTASDGRVLRCMTAEDELLWGHLRQLCEETFRACVDWLDEQTIAATLLDVEPLLDGRTLYFHFLANVEEVVQQQLDKFVELYEQQVRRSKFARLLEHGCGPGCGTAAAKNGCGSRGGCAVCKVASACK